MRDKTLIKRSRWYENFEMANFAEIFEAQSYKEAVTGSHKFDWKQATAEEFPSYHKNFSREVVD